uniref:Cysteine proteinase inhibitor n=1 Tax=Salix viminalis TaxID=40686 RepID=A0A6N2L8I0_SALVM
MTLNLSECDIGVCEGNEGERASGFGTMHHLTIEDIEAGKKKLYEAKVWVKPSLNFKELHEFKMPVATVVGGGNIFHGSSCGLDGHLLIILKLMISLSYLLSNESRILASVMNATFLKATMESIGISKRVQTAFRMSEKCRQTFGKRKGCDFRSWNWESIFHHGYCRSPMMGRKFLHLSPTCSYANSCFSGSISSLYRKGVILPRSARFKCYCIRSNNSCNSEKISLSSIKYSEKCQKWEQKALALPERSEKLYQKGIQ